MFTDINCYKITIIFPQTRNFGTASKDGAYIVISIRQRYLVLIFFHIKSKSFNPSWL